MKWPIQGSDSDRTLLPATIATLAGAEPLNRASSRRNPGHTVIAWPGEPPCTTRLVLKQWDLGGDRLTYRFRPATGRRQHDCAGLPLPHRCAQAQRAGTDLRGERLAHLCADAADAAAD